MNTTPSPQDEPRHLYLIGPPGAGKSALGPRLAEALQLQFHDCDRRVEQLAGQSIEAIFADAGEERFRDFEEQALAQLSAGEPAVIATGGGAVLRAANRREMSRQGLVVYLHASPETLCQRIASGTKRPLLDNSRPQAALRKLIAERAHLYRELADYKLNTDTVGSKPVPRQMANGSPVSRNTAVRDADLDRAVRQIAERFRRVAGTAT